MRKLQEELDKLIDFAKKNENIRGLVLQGSVVNPKAPLDEFSDLDPLFYCKDVHEFTDHDDWKKHFGNPMSYFHDEWDMKDQQKGYTRLTIYDDGFKMDFGFQDISMAQYANDMELYKIYLDKDGFIPNPDRTTDIGFYQKPPSEEEYQAVIRDFLFDSSYVIKTIFRQEITFNQYMMYILHKKINRLLTWYVGCNHDFQVNTGIYNRYIKHYLSDQEWTMVQKTYSDTLAIHVYEALLASFTLVEYLGQRIANKLSFTYPQKHHDDMLAYCHSFHPEKHSYVKL